MMIILSILLPIELKFGAEKARIIIIVMTFLIFAIGVAVVKSGKSIPLALTNWFGQIEQKPELAAVAALAAGIIVLGISCRISIGIMNKKELYNKDFILYILKIRSHYVTIWAEKFIIGDVRDAQFYKNGH